MRMENVSNAKRLKFVKEYNDFDNLQIWYYPLSASPDRVEKNSFYLDSSSVKTIGKVEIGFGLLY